jgi:hypothetical protein
LTAIHCPEESMMGELEILLLDQDHQHHSVSMIVVTGCEAHNPDVARMLSSALAVHVRTALLIPMSLTCIAAIVDRTAADVCMRALHAAITRRPGQV